jgi:S-adenosylmethionine:tRNA ribosyltransferase-isomerase
MINISDYTYQLPEERIAKFPLAERDQSKLLVYSKEGAISHRNFKDILSFLPEGSLMVFNDTKVIPARLHFQKESGAEIEVFLLNPEEPSVLLQLAMQSSSQCTWSCTIGNLKRWKDNTVLEKDLGFSLLRARLINREKQLVEFNWTNQVSFAKIVDTCGEIPLPPYLKRDAVESDKQRYQTVYSHYEGAVAAPTAGLHFTPALVEELRSKNIHSSFVTLHVSAGTFQPIKTENALVHAMHNEQIVVTKQTIEQFLNHQNKIIPVGTTSMRTVESLYWMGVNLLTAKENPFVITQKTPYEKEVTVPATESLQALLHFLQENKEDTIIGHTSIYIHPGYTFRMCEALITNFHQPGSTLILLVAAFVGNDWKRIYKEALDNQYRFLSYGDSSLLWKK